MAISGSALDSALIAQKEGKHANARANGENEEEISTVVCCLSRKRNDKNPHRLPFSDIAPCHTVQ